MRQKLWAFALAALCLAACSQRGEDVRIMNYFPEGRDIVCLNGSGRYTRPLYGTHTRFRLETSDRPLFASYDKERSRNFAFSLSVGGEVFPLEQTTWCKASYQGGRRIYELRDAAWGDEARVFVYAMASFFEEAALWQFRCEGFETEELELRVSCREIVGKRFNRDGDLGTDARELFEAAPVEGLTTSWAASGESYCLFDNASLSMGVLALEPGRERFAKEEEARVTLVSQVEITTPDPYFNTLGANLMAAADGIWDGTTVLHGACGWRTRLAGWRGGYTPDVVGWGDRAKSHFREYSKSMVTEVPPVLAQPQQDSLRGMAASLKAWGTPIYSNGYICRLPGRTDQISHYDMNLNYIDELLTHFGYDADLEFMRYMWPYIKLHHEWEKRNFDYDGDHLYDAFCCIWASDALYYNGGAVTHSSAYNYRSNLLTARIAELLGEDPGPYLEEAQAIAKAMDERLWMDDLGYWAEFQDYMGLKRLHKSAAVWSVYTPIDCGVGTSEQAYRATCYVDRSMARIPVRYRYNSEALRGLGLSMPKAEKGLYTIATTDWLPYVWSTNNVAHEEVANMALAYLKAGRNDSGFQLLKADLLDGMYLGACPGNFGQISYYDKARNEAYRDFADNVGTTSRAVINGLFGIEADALHGRCYIRPAFPDDWKQASIKTPYLSFSFRREGSKDIYEIEQNFAQALEIVVRSNAGGGAYLETVGTSEGAQTIVVDRTKLPKPLKHKSIRSEKSKAASRSYMAQMGLGDISRTGERRFVEIESEFNSNVDDIFRNDYLSPRPEFTTLQIPRQGVGDWCTPMVRPEIEDDGFRACLKDDVFDTGIGGLQFRSPALGHNIAYASLWDNYPDSLSFALSGSARAAYLLMAGSTNNMQSRIENARITAHYSDGTCSEMPLENPINWCPIQQDYYTDEYSFWTAPKRPYRVLLSNGVTGRDVYVDFYAAAENDSAGLDYLKKTDRGIPGGAAQILKMPLRADKTLESLSLNVLSNEIVVGIMGITLEK